ncbi:MAG: response regulator [Deltaproteobacteria bacterium]|nr:response regulator [Deltaproteobacteria bacterium]MBW1951838.1 response regulator [Deltaproteobacteria bacterium]MBW1986581.1 response regulator [Deltaproteobacteria bacterium]MBW2133739.1 response regulator [Deltaproteobacteria bacterium]
MARILFGDSDPHIQLLCQEEFLDEGYEVMVASDGQELIRLMDAAHPDLVVMELLLPDMSGLETMRIIKGTAKETPVIFYSAYNLSLPANAIGADGLVLKSSDMELLKKAVRKFIKVKKVAQFSNGNSCN